MRCGNAVVLALAASSFPMNQAADAAICPDIVSPVCALSASDKLQSFTNACEAQHAGSTVLHQGKCNGRFCPHNCVVHGVYAKGIKTGIVKLYDNICWAEKDFAVFVKYGACPRD